MIIEAMLIFFEEKICNGCRQCKVQHGRIDVEISTGITMAAPGQNGCQWKNISTAMRIDSHQHFGNIIRKRSMDN
jgi:hypothetical protein